MEKKKKIIKYKEGDRYTIGQFDEGRHDAFIINEMTILFLEHGRRSPGSS